MTELATTANNPFDPLDQPLRNAAKFTMTTCWTCGEPIDPTFRSVLCRHCDAHRHLPGTANLVLPVVYAVAGQPTATLLRRYKDAPSRATRTAATSLIGSLVTTVLTRHTQCFEELVGIPVAVRVTVPSLTFRPGTHPFARILRETGIDVDDVLRASPDATCDRRVGGDKFHVADRSRVSGRHVLVLDDVWTTGSTAQSASMALRRAGAAAVSVMPVARWINPDYPPSAAFLASSGDAGFDPAVCPATGWRCRLS